MARADEVRAMVRRDGRVLAALGLLCGSGMALGQAASAVLTPPAGNVAYLLAHATGTQNYVCLSSTASGVATTAWSSVGPQATLRVERSVAGRSLTWQVATHFLSPVPTDMPSAKAACTLSEDGKALYCPTWQSSFDSSAVWGSKLASVAAGTDESCPTAGSVPCLLLQAVANRAGTFDEGLFARTTYIQRLNTVGGSAPAGSCKVGALALVPYSADYTFFRDAERGDGRGGAR